MTLRGERLKVEMDCFDLINSQNGEVIYFYLHCPKSKICLLLRM